MLTATTPGTWLPRQRYYRTAEPGVQPLELAEVKAFLRVDHSHEDPVIARMLSAAVKHLDGTGKERDGVLGRAMIDQTWVLEAERPDCDGRVWIRHGDVRSITSVEVMLDGSYTPFDASDRRLGFRDGTAFVMPLQDKSWPSYDCREDAFKITYLAGYGAAATDVPDDLIEAMLMHIAHLYNNRETVMTGGEKPVPLPFGYDDHIEPYRIPVIR